MSRSFSWFHICLAQLTFWLVKFFISAIDNQSPVWTFSNFFSFSDGLFQAKMCERHRLIDSCPILCLHGSLLYFYVNNAVQYFKVDKPKGTSGDDIKETNVVTLTDIQLFPLWIFGFLWTHIRLILLISIIKSKCNICINRSVKGLTNDITSFLRWSDDENDLKSLVLSD